MKKTIVYKLTDGDSETRNHTQWGNNISHTAKGDGTKLCSDGFIHYYTHPLLAVLISPIHISFICQKLWEAEASGEIINEPLKSGCKTLKTIKEIPLPEISGVQIIAFGILCAKEVYKNEAWNLWADKWLSGEDRSKESASAAAVASTKRFARYDCLSDSAAYYATQSVTDSIYFAAINTAKAVADAADADESINLIALAKKAMTYK